MKLPQAQPIGENVVMVKLEKDALEQAAGSLLQLADVIGPWFEKQNFDGQGKRMRRTFAKTSKRVLPPARYCWRQSSRKPTRSSKLSDGGGLG